MQGNFTSTRKKMLSNLKSKAKTFIEEFLKEKKKPVLYQATIIFVLIYFLEKNSF